jgi:hypothetical protein
MNGHKIKTKIWVTPVTKLGPELSKWFNKEQQLPSYFMMVDWKHCLLNGTYGDLLEWEKPDSNLLDFEPNTTP